MERGPDSYQTMVARGRLGEALLLAGQRAEAEPILAANVASRRKSVPNHASTFTMIANLAETRLYLNRPAEAEAGLREAVAGHKAAMPATDNLQFYNLGRLGAAVAAQGRYAEAEPMLRDAIVGLEASKFPRPDYRDRCLGWLADLHAKWGKPADAERVRAAKAK
jgi:hypothetical protein